jgi:hypothetical protein
MGFTSFSQNTSKGKESFCEGVTGKTKQSTDLPLVCAKAPGNKTHPAIGSTGMGAAEDRRIPVRWVPRGLGKSRDGTCVHIGLGSRVWMGQSGGW